ncbi:MULTISPECIES: hypothetical protein [Microbispora]|uniref:Uncharacterized protein n=4 Tax=Microbispora TaxID=2005 RepID=A0ABY3LQJ3_9ACTN|nr:MULTISPECIES: hypothetical protein [Microbispora]KAA9380394.1 hypothetical protein F5972_04275 [Microbispora cellulosiformans]MBO4274501.1 hypothetical protein [Microbispora triticiradicis]TLP64007.1 hypothetical protein FED44_07260 [Microbispora fusca]TYB50287.1 hypothetical protein FXF59_28840 [Microbispora tritici]WSS07210.1 RNA-binding protein [Microbispora sp. NBC_01189]
MTTQTGKDNLDLAASAEALADSAPTGSLRHAAAKSVAITFATTRDAAQARDTLNGLAPDDVRRAALELFDELFARAD